MSIDPVLGLTIALVFVLLFGQFTVGLVTEGQTDLAQASLELSAGANLTSIETLFANLQERCNRIKKRIDDINKEIPRNIKDITVSTVQYVNWEEKEKAIIQIKKKPYKLKGNPSEKNKCACNYGCKWLIEMTLPIGQKGEQGPIGDVGPPGKDGDPGQTGERGAQGNWATVARS